MENKDKTIDKNVEDCLSEVMYNSKWFGDTFWLGCALIGICTGAVLAELLFKPTSRIVNVIGAIVFAAIFVFIGNFLNKDAERLVRRTAYRYEEKIWRLQEHNRYLEDRIRSLEEKLY